MSNFTHASSIALPDAPMRKRVSESGVRLMQTAIFTVGPHRKDSVVNLAALSAAASAEDVSVSARWQRDQLVTGRRRTILARAARASGMACQRPTLRYRFPSK